MECRHLHNVCHKHTLLLRLCRLVQSAENHTVIDFIREIHFYQRPLSDLNGNFSHSNLTHSKTTISMTSNEVITTKQQLPYYTAYSTVLEYIHFTRTRNTYTTVQSLYI